MSETRKLAAILCSDVVGFSREVRSSLILAENTPAETFVDNVDRLHFDNWAEYEALYPYGDGLCHCRPARKRQHEADYRCRERMKNGLPHELSPIDRVACSWSIFHDDDRRVSREGEPAICRHISNLR